MTQLEETLLNACHIAEPYLVKMMLDGANTAMPVRKALERIRAAIAKAEGQENPSGQAR